MPRRDEWAVRLDGASAAELDRLLNDLPVDMARKVRGAARFAAAKVVRDEARASTAFKDKSGRLRRTIRVTRSGGYTETVNGQRKRVPGQFVSVRAGGAGARQPVLVEYGHGGPRPAPPHPFMENAVRSARKTAFAAALAAARRGLRRLARARTSPSRAT